MLDSPSRPVSIDVSGGRYLRLDDLVERENRGFPLDREDVARALLVDVRRWAGLAQPIDRDSAVQVVAWRLLRSWESGQRSLQEVKAVASRALANEAKDQYRQRRRDPSSSLDAPLADGRVPGDVHAKIEPTVEETVEMRERLSGVAAEVEALESYLASARPVVAAIEQLASKGYGRQQIVELLAEQGFVVTHENVRQIVSRLQRRFPDLRFRWENKETAPTATDTPRRRLPATGERAYRACEATADKIVQAVAWARRRLDAGERPDWSIVATDATVILGRGISSLEARMTWQRFLAQLPPEVRRAAP